MSVSANPVLTGTELDLARLQVGDGHYRAPYTRKNQLDNWYFVGGGDQQGAGQFPINQKKQTNYTVQGGYGIDRWRLWSRGSTGLTLQSDGVTLSPASSSSYQTGPFIAQIVENPSRFIGKTITLSALVDCPSGTSGTFCIFNSAYNIIKSVPFDSSNTLLSVSLENVSQSFYAVGFLMTKSATNPILIKAVKLELGDTQTLAHLENGVWVLNEIPDYTTQLLRCQRFFHVFTSTSASTTGYGYSTNPKNLRPEMRATPSTGSFTYGGTTYYYLDANL